MSFALIAHRTIPNEPLRTVYAGMRPLHSSRTLSWGGSVPGMRPYPLAEAAAALGLYVINEGLAISSLAVAPLEVFGFGWV